MTRTGQDVSDLFGLEVLEKNLFRADVHEDAGTGHIFGGLVVGQALRAAALTVADPTTLPHSLHSYFLRMGDPARPVIYRVSADRDGRSFAARRVEALQGGQVIFTLSCSFCRPYEGGAEFQHDPFPTYGHEDPETLPEFETEASLLGVRIRVPEQPMPNMRMPSRVWVKVEGELGDDPIMHLAAMGYFSDISNGMTLSPTIWEHDNLTSLDHAMWFYLPARVDDWVLMELRPEQAAHGRAMYTGRIYSRDGRLMAGLAQEHLYRKDRPSGL
jgi:acyl-CoA thioesterase-2